MMKQLFAVFAVLAGAVGAPAWAVVKCETVPIKSETSVKIGSKTLKKLTTGYDAAVKSACGPDWTNGDDYWLYGAFYALYKAPPFKTAKEKEQWVASREQPALERKVCWDAGEGGDEVAKPKNIVGYYAYEATNTSLGDGPGVKRNMELHLLCVAESSRGGGQGIDLLNRAIADASARVLEGQSVSVKIVALKKAEPFYEKLQLNCESLDEGKVYTGTVVKGGAVERWPVLFRAEDCDRVEFDCASLASVNDAREKGILVEGWTMKQAEERRGQPKPTCVENRGTETVKFSKVSLDD